MDKPKLIVMVGLQGSGKSTIAKELAINEYAESEIFSEPKVLQQTTEGPITCKSETRYAIIISSDSIRKTNPELDNTEVFKQVYDITNDMLNINRNVILDATNISIKSRKQIFNNIKVDCEKIAYVVNTPIDICKERVIERNKDEDSHFVPLTVLDRYHKSFQVPFKEEGWDEVVLYNKIDADVTSIYDDGILSEMLEFNQNNPNHTLTLGEHSRRVYYGLREMLPKRDLCDDEQLNLRFGAYLHDVGKLWTKTPNKKDPSISSYYGHENVGAYWKLCHGWEIEETFYENYHMLVHNWKTDKAKNKWKKIFGEEKFNNLLILNKCDINAH